MREVVLPLRNRTQQTQPLQPPDTAEQCTGSVPQSSRQQLGSKRATDRGRASQDLALLFGNPCQLVGDQRLDAVTRGGIAALPRTGEFEHKQRVAATLAERFCRGVAVWRCPKQASSLSLRQRADRKQLQSIIARERCYQAFSPTIVVHLARTRRPGHQQAGDFATHQHMQQGRGGFVDPLQVVEQQRYRP